MCFNVDYTLLLLDLLISKPKNTLLNFEAALYINCINIINRKSFTTGHRPPQKIATKTSCVVHISSRFLQYSPVSVHLCCWFAPLVTGAGSLPEIIFSTPYPLLPQLLMGPHETRRCCWNFVYLYRWVLPK